MAVDLRRDALHRAVTELIAFETELERALRREQQTVLAHADAVAALERLLPMVASQRERLAIYLKTLGSGSAGVSSTAPFVFSSSATVSAALRQISVAFSHGAISYGILYEMALRLYEPPLREIAPKHLKAYTDAALEVNRLVPAVVAWELVRDALNCACICPLCGIGACGCIFLGTQTLVAAWREMDSSLPGFVLQAPRPESELARAGVQGGERLLAIDGQELRARVTSVWNDLIRKHALGEEVRLLVQRGSEPPREVAVRHVSDYPKS